MTNWTGGPGGYGGPGQGGYPGPPNPAGPTPAPPDWHADATMPAQVWQMGPPVGAPAPNPFVGPPPKNRKPLIISLIVGAAVVAVVVVVVVVATVANMSGGPNGTAGDAVKGYLQALARGDAESALSYSTDQPASTDLLTDEVLQEQIDKWPVTDIQILDDSSTHGGFGFAQVHVSAKFGAQTSDVTMNVELKGDDWKLDHSAIKIDTQTGGTNNKSLEALTIFGKPATGTLYVFPGWMDFASSNPNLSMTAKPMLLDKLTSYGGSLIDVKVELSDEGSRAVLAGVSDALSQCQKSSSLNPPGCPVRVTDSSIVDGTAVWGPADMSQVKITMFDEYRMQAMFSGEVTIPLTAQARTGGTKTGTASAFLSGTADVERTPPTLDFR